MKKLILALALLVSFSVSAKDCEKEADAGGMVAYRECIAGKKTNQVEQAYQNLLNALKGNNDLIANAQATQRTWIAYRDATCIYIGETVTREDQATCINDFNKARVKMLKLYAKQKN